MDHTIFDTVGTSAVLSLGGVEGITGRGTPGDDTVRVGFASPA